MARFHEGQHIGRFEILQLLGRGGVGEAYLAKDTRLQRQVVIKCLREDLHSRFADAGVGETQSKLLVQDVEARFWTEARAQAHLNHPNLCTIFDLDEENRFIVLEHVEGVTLEQRRAAGTVPRDELAMISIGIAEGVRHAHANGVLHRDLTMKNVMIAASSRVKVLDFGLAKLVGENRLTQFGIIAGTPEYMSPEQRRGDRGLDDRSDIFSLGVMIYRLVTGSFPYPAKAGSRADPEPIPPAPFVAFGIDWPMLDLVVMKALQWNVEDRFRSMEEMHADLLRVHKALARTEHSYYFFDTSTLAEVLCPSTPKRSKRAANQFEIRHSKGSAVTSATVLSELLDHTLGLYFEAKPRAIGKDDRIRELVEEAKGEIRRRSGALPSIWGDLGWEDKLVFLSSTRGLFRRKLEAIASQFAAVETDNGILQSKLIDFAIDLRVRERDVRVLAEAFSMRAGWMYSEERRYRAGAYRRVLHRDRRLANLYQLSECVQPPNKREGIIPDGISTITIRSEPTAGA